jgi:DNA-binding response OmpR family regulator
LIAEDDEALRKLASTVLGQFGYTVIEAVDGEDAVLKFIENRDRIQLIILDAIMPRKNGKQAYDEISSVAPGIKTLFASGYTADVIRPTGVLEKDMHFILKPVSPVDLLKKVREVLDA